MTLIKAICDPDGHSKLTVHDFVHLSAEQYILRLSAQMHNVIDKLKSPVYRIMDMAREREDLLVTSTKVKTQSIETNANRELEAVTPSKDLSLKPGTSFYIDIGASGQTIPDKAPLVCYIPHLIKNYVHQDDLHKDDKDQREEFPIRAFLLKNVRRGKNSVDQIIKKNEEVVDIKDWRVFNDAQPPGPLKVQPKPGVYSVLVIGNVTQDPKILFGDSDVQGELTETHINHLCNFLQNAVHTDDDLVMGIVDYRVTDG